MESQKSLEVFGCSCLKTVNGLADGTRERRNCFLAAARGLGFETSVLEPCVLVSRNTQQKYHGIVGVAVDDIAGGRDEVWRTGNLQVETTFHFRTLGSGKGEIIRSRGGARSRWIHACWAASLHQEPGLCALGKLRKEESGDANVSEKTVMRSVLGALGYLARESRPDLSGPVSILQTRFNKAQVPDIQETNRVVRLAKAHTDLALPVCKIPLDRSALCLMEMPVVAVPVLNKQKLGM